jgi:ATP-dependent Lon protease
LPVGGIKEKMLAAFRSGIKNVILCEENRKDLEDVPAKVKKQLTFHLVKTLDEVLELALVTSPTLTSGSKAPPDRKTRGEEPQEEPVVQ